MQYRKAKVRFSKKTVIYQEVIPDGTIVSMAEKLHGSFVCIGIIPGLNHPELTNGDSFAASKGLFAQGLVFKDNEANANNLYLQTVKKLGLFEKFRTAMFSELHNGLSVYLMGEIYGQVQDLHYGLKENKFAAFDIALRNGTDICFFNETDKRDVFAFMGIDRVPVLYTGPFSQAVLQEHTEGKTVAGNGAHIREGVVVTPVVNASHPELGRVILKSINPDYLTRKNGTEFN